jgi:hypothetical protein
MSRETLTLAGFFAAGCLAVVGYSLATRDGLPVDQEPRPLVTASLAAPLPSSGPPSRPPEPLPSPSTPAEAAAVPTPIPTGVNKFAADAVSEDPRARAVAISALARVPKETALPALKKVLTGGDPEVDRPLALESLQTIALEQGDEDGRVKDLLRQTVVHSDNEKFAEAAQRTLDTIP